MSIATALSRSVYTSLLLILTAVAAAWAWSDAAPATAVSLGFAAAGVVICLLAWRSRIWRREAGTVRHVLIALCGLACAALTALGVLRLFS
ncbi:MAG: hypothetical protein ACYSTY_08125 [Planctomycetota bacterium]|jgi:hypothetical protein